MITTFRYLDFSVLVNSLEPSDQDAGSPPEIPDGKLVEMVLRGDLTAFEQLVHRYQPALLRLANSKLQRPELAEEALQETFLAAHKSLHTYDSRFAFRTWLWTILINQCRRIGSRQGRSTVQLCAVGTELNALASQDKHPDEQVADRESRQRLQAMLDQISPMQATALRLRFFEGLKFHEIAEQMQCSLSAAKQRVRTGLSLIAEKMQRSDNGWSQRIENNQNEHPPSGRMHREVEE
jgi:RNA polymerase sigma-70 factor (ECF subfamily)